MNIDTNVNFDIDTDELVGEMESDIARIAVENADDIVSEAADTIRDLAREAIDADDLVREADYTIRDIVSDALGDSDFITGDDVMNHVDLSDYVREGEFDISDQVAAEVHDLVGSFPTEFTGRCSLGRAFTEAVYACINDVIGADDPHDHYNPEAQQMLAALRSAVSPTVTLTTTGDVTLQVAEAEAQERFCVTVNDAYGRTTTIYGPFAGRDAAVEFQGTLHGVYSALVVPMASEAPVVVGAVTADYTPVQHGEY